MPYKPRHRRATVKRASKYALAILREAKREIAKRDLADLRVTVSPGNVKTGLIPSVSLPPIVSCPKGAPCRGSCYVLQNKYVGPHARAIATSYAKNWRIWREAPDRFEEDIRRFLDRKAPRLFRWHVSGDIPSQAYWAMMRRLAREFPAVRFLVFTKAYHLTFSSRPSNLSVVFSAWPRLPLPRKARRYPIAFVDLDPRAAAADPLVCPGNCESCGMCWALPEMSRNVVFPLH